VGEQRQRLDAEDGAVLGIGRALQRGGGVEGGGAGAAQPGQRIHAFAPFSAARRTLFLASGPEIVRGSQRSKLALRAGHSPSSIENQAVSRLRPLTIMCWRKMPS